VFVGVPRVFQKIYDRVQQTIQESLWHRRKLFNYAYQTKVEAMAKNEATPWLDSLVFAKIRARLGGRIRLIVSGSAPLSPTLQQFERVCFCCPVIQGYGLSETCAVTTVQLDQDQTLGHVGPPVPSNEVKLISVPEMNYTPDDKPFPRGEIAIRGINVFVGYYKDPERTQEAFTEDGFFKTGDIGQWNKDGTLSIIDRKKNIFKLAQGEYVAAEKLEGIYVRSKYIAQVFVYGDSLQNYLVSVIVPEAETVIPWAKANNLLPNGNYTMATLCADERVRRLIQAELAEEAAKAGLNGFELMKDFWLEPLEFSLENQLITPTFKLVRTKLKARYQNEIQQMYMRSGPTGNGPVEVKVKKEKKEKKAKL